MNKSEIKYMGTFLVKGPRIYLEPVTVNDVNETYKAWLADAEVNQFLETRFEEQTIEKIKNYVTKMERSRETEPFFKICLKENLKHIGNIKLGPINFQHRNGDVSLLIGDKSCWGKGYASEAISLITYFAFEVLKLNKLKAGCYAANIGSARAFKKCGYKQEAVLRNHVIYKDKPMDLLLFGITLQDYKAHP